MVTGEPNLELDLPSVSNLGHALNASYLILRTIAFGSVSRGNEDVIALPPVQRGQTLSHGDGVVAWRSRLRQCRPAWSSDLSMQVESTAPHEYALVSVDWN